MDSKLLAMTGIVAVFVIYMCVTAIKSTQQKKRWGKQSTDLSREKEPLDIGVFLEGEEEDVDSSLSFQEVGKRFSHEVTFLLTGDETHSFMVYSNQETMSRETVLNDLFYVNDRELLLRSESGDRYVNRNRIEEILFNTRKLMGHDQSDVETSESLEVPEEPIEEVGTGVSGDDFKTVSATIDERLAELGVDDEVVEGLPIKPKKTYFFTRKVKQTKEKVPRQPKRITQKVVTIIMAISTAFVLSSGVFAFLRVSAVSQKAKSAAVMAESVQASVKTLEGKDETYHAMTDYFMKQFLNDYLTITKDSDGEKARQERLMAYSNKSLVVNELGDATEMKLDQASLIKIVPSGAYHVAEYQVSYKVVGVKEVTQERVVTQEAPASDVPETDVKVDATKPLSEQNVSKVTEEGEKKAITDTDKTEKVITETYTETDEQLITTLISVPYVEENGKFTVVSTPYFSPVENLSGQGSEAVKVYKKVEKASQEETEKVAEFLALFLEKYRSDNLKDMEYLMKSPELLGANFNVKESPFNVYRIDGRLLVFVSLTLETKDSGLIFSEHMTLELSEKEKNYYVETLEHIKGVVE